MTTGAATRRRPPSWRVVTAALDAVANLDEDRILRQYPGADPGHAAHQLLPAQIGGDGDGGFKPVLSFKFDPAQVPGLPEPRPMFEIFVYSPRVEGVHLRGGRWRAAACAGPTGWRTSAPRCWAW